MRMFASLRERCPRLGRAAYQHWYEMDMTGDYPGQRTDEILRHDESTGRCSRCGATEHRQFILSRILVGPNAGVLHRWWSRDCATSSSGGLSSNYRQPWTEARRAA